MYQPVSDYDEGSHLEIELRANISIIGRYACNAYCVINKMFKTIISFIII